MNFEQHDQRVRDASLKRAFPVERDTPEQLRQLLEQLSSRTRPREGGEAERTR